MKEKTIINTAEATLIVKKNIYNVIINTETFFVSMLKDIFTIFMLLHRIRNQVYVFFTEQNC